MLVALFRNKKLSVFCSQHRGGGIKGSLIVWLCQIDAGIGVETVTFHGPFLPVTVLFSHHGPFIARDGLSSHEKLTV